MGGDPGKSIITLLPFLQPREIQLAFSTLQSNCFSSLECPITVDENRYNTELEFHPFIRKERYPAVTKSRTKRALDGSKQKSEIYLSQVWRDEPIHSTVEGASVSWRPKLEFLWLKPRKKCRFATFIWKNRDKSQLNPGMTPIKSKILRFHN